MVGFLIAGHNSCIFNFLLCVEGNTSPILFPPFDIKHLCNITYLSNRCVYASSCTCIGVCVCVCAFLNLQNFHSITMSCIYIGKCFHRLLSNTVSEARNLAPAKNFHFNTCTCACTYIHVRYIGFPHVER